VTTLFQYGATTAFDVAMMSRSLIGFAAGLMGLVLVKVLAPGFFARQNTKTPVKVGVVAMAVNMVAAVLLFYPFKHVGLAVATSIAAWVNAALLFKLLRRESVYNPLPGWAAFFAKIAAAGALMAVTVHWLGGELDSWIEAATLERVGRLALCVGAGAASYFAVLFAAGIRPKHLVLNKAEFDL
jgi:putative peptidoglycan lipid II flippase